MNIEIPRSDIAEEPSKLPVTRSLLSKVLDAESYWGMSRSTSWPECGAIPRDNSSVFPDSAFKAPDDLTEDTVAVYLFDDEKGLEVLHRDRTDGGESLEDFKSRVAMVVGRTSHPQVSED